MKLGEWSGKPTPLVLSEEQITKAIDFYGEDVCNEACERLGFASLNEIPLSRKSDFAKVCKEVKGAK